jgi:hypothetical protein
MRMNSAYPSGGLSLYQFISPRRKKWWGIMDAVRGLRSLFFSDNASDKNEDTTDSPEC